MTNTSSPQKPINIAVLTVSDTRTVATDKSGATLIELLRGAGHQLAQHAIVKDDVYQIRAAVSGWIADSNVHAVLVTGGTGFTARDTTPDALLPLFDQVIEGFGELFRSLSFTEIGSTGACKTAWNGIICEQLDSRHKPCNFVEMVTFHSSNDLTS